MQARPLGGLRPFIAVAAVLTVAAWPSATHSQVDVGRAGTGSTAPRAVEPQLWGVEIDAYSTSLLRPAYVARMKKAGINALVVDPTRLTFPQLGTSLKVARQAKLRLVEVTPPARAKSTPSVNAVRATCRASRKPAGTLCAVRAGSISSALGLARRGRRGGITVVRLTGPEQLAKLADAAASGSRILALVKLAVQPSVDKASWHDAIAIAATRTSVDLAVSPSGFSKQQALGDYLGLLAGVANVFVAPNGSDSGANCKRFATGRAFPSDRTTVCRTINKAYQLATCGDNILVGGGTYANGAADVAYDSSKDACTSATRININVVSGETVNTNEIYAKGSEHFFVSGAQGTWNINSTTDGADGVYAFASDGYSCTGHPATDVIFDHISNAHASKIGCDPNPSVVSNITIQHSDLGNNDGCTSEDVLQLRGANNVTLKGNYFHDLYHSADCTSNHSDCIQAMGPDNGLTLDGNTAIRCWSEFIITKGDFGPISNITISNNVIGNPINDCGNYFAGDCGGGPGSIDLDNSAGNCSNTTILNNSIAEGNVTDQCGGSMLIASNLLASGVFLVGNVNCATTSSTVLYNAWTGRSGACGSHTTTNAKPNWPNANPNCTNPNTSPSCIPAMTIGSGSTGVIDKGSLTAGQYTPTDINGAPRPLGNAPDVGAYETSKVHHGR